MSSFTNVSLSKYVSLRKEFCANKHNTPCSKCASFLTIAHSILKDGYVVMSEAFRNTFPHIKYTAEAARRKLFQMPLVCIVVGDVKSGQSVSYLLEYTHGLDYKAIHRLLALMYTANANIKWRKLNPIYGNQTHTDARTHACIYTNERTHTHMHMNTRAGMLSRTLACTYK